ncbi:MAG: SAM-dependent chlorinase/fluorinase [Pyrinomonas methylaliphatogenes]|jgi:S-adenosylmethionine hydrolase|uniref:Adenosyl-chloride synthase n=2 Tax=Pyrinomonas methylaliphatogenes TaxID=454194 RepID=A0A0B6WY64_9BACT|nr:SAM-dependent chlorinase/fluorinase [Pyrinomonas methylaliphatogenes]CDM65667.1 hypothetical protein PYK22_01672 [Pyrinomonas methylaliphatogenes]
MFITLATDFGTSDYFVGAMRGVILARNPQARIFDITHEIPAHDIRAGAFILLAAYREYPERTVHVAVVDPGVGSARRPILIVTPRYFFIGPDNGLFSYVCEREGEVRAFHLTNERFFRHPVSATFHGRDIFAPVAASLTLGVPPEEFGPPIDDLVQLEPLAPQRVGENEMRARIVHIDRFGNCITNLTRADLTEEMIARGAHLLANGRKISSFRRFFDEGTTDEPFAVWGSAGFLEIVIKLDSAAQKLGLVRGQEIIVRLAGD